MLAPLPKKNLGGPEGTAPEKDPEKDAPPRERPEIEILRERIEKLEAELKKEKVPPVPQEKEKMVKGEIKAYLREMQRIPPTAAPLATRDEADEIKRFPPSQQVGALISLVFEKGLPEAISVARNLNNPAILDEFHDTLVDRYYQELVEKKFIQP